MALPTILIVGRPNVGKSTLFNRLSRQKKAIVCDLPGVTRDLIFNYCTWENHRFILIDSGGIFFESVDEKASPFQAQIETMVQAAITTADYIFFVASAEDNLTPYDQVIAKNLMPFKNKTALVVNKTDELEQARNLMEFHRLGFDLISFVSATQAKGIDSMMEDVFAKLPPDKQGFNQPPPGDAIPVSIVGRPNVGKSSILNALAGAERSLVSDIPGTTRDSIDHTITANKQDYLFVDTAGLKKKSKNEDG
ncbi:MAG: GTPase, partial [Candidatus Margulisiibacteriota bacterium]